MFDVRLLIRTGILRRNGYIQRVEKGQYFFRKNDTGEEMYIVISGKVGIVIADDEPPIAELGAGELFGEMTFLEKMPRSASAIAVEDTLAIAINHNNFGKIMKREPAIALNIMKTLSSRIRNMNEKKTRSKKVAVQTEPSEAGL